jgi:hypothetical protein
MAKTATPERAVTTGGIGRGPVVVAALGVLWFAATLWLTHYLVVLAEVPQVALVNAALSLPTVIAAGIVAGAAVAVVAVRRIRRLASARARTLAGVGVGLALGLVAAALVLVGYGTATALVSVAVTVAVATAVGGAFAGVPAQQAVVAGLVGTLAWFTVGWIERLFSGKLHEVFASDASPAAQFAAAGRLSLAVALIGGAVVGLAAYLYLRNSGLAWPAFLAAGAAPGLLLLAADLATRVGGGPLLGLAGRGSDADRIALEYVGANRLSTALVVLFTGAITAIVAHGRALPSSRGADPAPTGRTTPARGPRRRPR